MEWRLRLDLNVLPLGSYDLLIGMDWMEKHSVVVNYCNKTFNCLDDFGQGRTIKGIPWGVSKIDLHSTVKKECKERM
jgi:hypothetical protein